jgi:hypothetical protein
VTTRHLVGSYILSTTGINQDIKPLSPQKHTAALPVLLLSKLDELQFNILWAKNTNLSISGHITDLALWVTQKLDTMPLALTEDLATYLNGQVKRIKQRKEKFIPIEHLLIIVSRSQASKASDVNSIAQIQDKLPDNVISLSDYIKKQ